MDASGREVCVIQGLMVKKLLIGLAVLTIVGIGAVWAMTRSTPERVACSRLGELCGPEDASLKDLSQCVDDLEKVHEGVGEERFENTVKCIDESDSCARAVGCMAGTGANVLQDAVKEFLKGFDQTF